MVYVSIKLNLFCEFSLGEPILMILELCIFSVYRDEKILSVIFITTIRYRDDILEFSPSISQKDGSLMVPEGVTNAEKILDWDKIVQKGAYPYAIYERMKFIMCVG